MILPVKIGIYKYVRIIPITIRCITLVLELCAVFISLSYYKMAARCPDPVLSRLNPVRHVGAIPELLADKVTQFTDCDPRFYDDVDDTNMDR